jgi:acyl-CoA dehydrogenase
MLIPLGLLMLAPVIMAFGTAEQKAEYLPKILSGEHYWCQGYSEPGAGSDLASLKLKAETDGDDYIVNGSKIWTTHAHLADHIFCLVRTDNSGKPQAGISFLLIDMDTPGVTVEPIITMAGDHEVNQVFFDNVRVPRSNRIGEENQGWSYAKYLLEFERGGGFSAHRIRHELDNLHRMMAEAKKDNPAFDASGDLERRVARVEIDLKALEITELRILSAVSGGGNPGPESSIMKVTTVRLEQAVNELAVEVLGYTGFVMNPVAGGNPVRADYTNSVVPRYLNNRAASIFGGSQEVQRNIIAKLVLQL